MKLACLPKKRKQSMAEQRRKSLLRDQMHRRALTNKKNDQLLSADLRQKVRATNLQQIKSSTQFALKPAFLVATLKSKIGQKTRDEINVEVQNLLHLIYTVEGIIERMFVTQSVTNNSEISRAEADTQDAKSWIAKVYLLFKSFDVEQQTDKNKYVPEIENEVEFYPKVDEKLAEIKAEEERYLGQRKSLLMEIEDNEIRLIAKEQILKERIEEQTKRIGKLNRQILDARRKLEAFPTMSTLGPAMSRKVTATTRSQKARKSTNIIIFD